MKQYLSSRKACLALGVCRNTLMNWAEGGKIDFIKTPSGQRKYYIESVTKEIQQIKQICYCRVSSPKQKDDLDRQVKFLQEQYPNATIVKDIGSGINFKRKGLTALLEQAMQGHKFELIVAHKDRLARFGFDIIESIIKRVGGSILVLDRTSDSPESELTKDLLTILHVFSCRLHGLRNYKDQIAKDLPNYKSENNFQKVDRGVPESIQQNSSIIDIGRK